MKSILGNNLKLDVQHNMFLEIFPEKFFGLDEISPLLLRKIEIKSIEAKCLRSVEDCENRDVDPIWIIEIHMTNGKIHTESYGNMSHYGIHNQQIVWKRRYEDIKKQLSSA